MMRLLVLITASLCVSRCTGQCDVQVSGVADEYKTVIVKKHNELRAKVANGEQEKLPKASNMMEMVWDDAVAGKAQEWANKCKFAHDDKKDRDTGRGYTGQNIAWRSNSNPNPDWNEVIQSFYNEVSVFNINSVDKYVFYSDTGHFTQIIWANTYQVGCGYIRKKDGSNYYHLYGCDYLPGGNIKDQPIYKRGDPCSACGKCGSISGLCAAGTTADNAPTPIDDSEVTVRNRGSKRISYIIRMSEMFKNTLS